MINLEIFSCAGGMAEGFRRAGVNFDMAVDFAEDHCDSYERNLGTRPICLDVRDLLRMVALGWRAEIDLLVADPPCTPWSRGGKRLGTADERDMLVVTCQLIEALRPRRYLIGNVPGLDDGVNLPTVQRTIGGLTRFGYCTADYARLDAADYGVPQHRIRPFWFGHRDGTCIRWPSPSHCDPGETAVMPMFAEHALHRWVTCRDALGHLPDAQLGRQLRKHWIARKRNRHPSSRPNAPANCVTSGPTRQGNTLLWPWDRPSTTIQADDRIAPPGHHDESFAARTLPGVVQLSELAATILQGFPESWVFAGETKKARWSQIGQAMPPPLAAAVACSIVEQDRAAKESAA